MSLPVIRWAVEQRAPSAPSKFVLVALAYAVNHEHYITTCTATAFPSVAALCAMTQQDRKTVLASLSKLEGSKLIQRAGTAGRTGQVIRWRLLVDSSSTESGTGPNSGTGARIGTGAESGSVPFFPAKSPVSPSKESQIRDTEQRSNKEGTSNAVRTVRAPVTDRGSRLPADWSLPADWKAWAEAERPDLEVNATAAAFADYWHAKAGPQARKVDWLATWRNWVRNQRAPPLSGSPLTTRSQANLLHADTQFT